MKNKTNRRQLFRKSMRYLTLGVIGAGGGAIAAKRGKLVKENKCISESACGGCEILDECVLPRGMSARRVMEGKNG